MQLSPSKTGESALSSDSYADAERKELPEGTAKIVSKQGHASRGGMMLPPGQRGLPSGQVWANMKKLFK